MPLGEHPAWSSSQRSRPRLADPYARPPLSQLLDALEPLFPARDDEDQLSKGGIILDHHGCDLFPERWVDLVVVMTCDHTVLWERLEQRFVPGPPLPAAVSLLTLTSP